MKRIFTLFGISLYVSSIGTWYFTSSSQVEKGDLVLQIKIDQGDYDVFVCSAIVSDMYALKKNIVESENIPLKNCKKIIYIF